MPHPTPVTLILQCKANRHPLVSLNPVMPHGTEIPGGRGCGCPPWGNGAWDEAKQLTTQKRKAFPAERTMGEKVLRLEGHMQWA